MDTCTPTHICGINVDNSIGIDISTCHSTGIGTDICSSTNVGVDAGIRLVLAFAILSVLTGYTWQY